MLLDADDFKLFDLPRRFALDLAELDERRRVLQGQVHPDRHAGADAAAKRVAMQWAVRVNEAHRRLRDPLSRARYLCELGGTLIEAEDNTAMPAAFLMQQMEWREALDDAREPAEMQAIAEQIAVERGDAYARLAARLDDQQNFEAAAANVRALMFLDRFAADVDARLEARPA